MSHSRQTGIPPVTRALWKLERSLAWYGFATPHIGAVELIPDGTPRAKVSGVDSENSKMAVVDRRTGRLRL